MNLKQLTGRFKGRGPLITIVLDGWGIGHHGEGDAIHHAKKPTFDALQRYPHTQLFTHGPYVGLPSAKDIGGSEVGHLTLGAGRVFPQGPTRINKLIASGDFAKGEALNGLIGRCLAKGSALHLVGLLSDGNVHSHARHLDKLLEQAVADGHTRIRVHILPDGRDVSARSALTWVEPLEAKLAALRDQGISASIASGGVQCFTKKAMTAAGMVTPSGRRGRPLAALP